MTPSPNDALAKGDDEDEDEEDEEEEERTCYVLVAETRLRLLLSQQCRTEGCSHPCQVRQTTRGRISGIFTILSIGRVHI